MPASTSLRARRQPGRSCRAGPGRAVLFLQLRVDGLAVDVLFEAEDVLAGRDDEVEGLLVDLLWAWAASITGCLVVGADEPAFEPIEERGAADGAVVIARRTEMFSGGWPGFWTVNGAYFMPRKPAADRAVPPTEMNAGRSAFLIASTSMRLVVGQHRADGGVVEHRAGLLPGVHACSVPRSWSPSFGVQRPDDRQVLELLGDVRQVLGDLDAAGGGGLGLVLAAVRAARLDVPEVDGRRAAAHPQDDEALLLLLHLRRGRPHLRRNCRPGTVTAAAPAACFRKCRRSVIPNMWECSDWAGHL